jgi:hypothetical protein
MVIWPRSKSRSFTRSSRHSLRQSAGPAAGRSAPGYTLEAGESDYSRLMLRAAVVSLLLSVGIAQTPAATYDVHAVRFASVPYQVRNLVAGAEAGRSIDIAFTV